LRDALVEIQKSIQEKHLACCIFPRFHDAPEIARAMHQLSLKRIGALIALEQEIGLGDYVIRRTEHHPPHALNSYRIKGFTKQAQFLPPSSLNDKNIPGQQD
jgi:DNA integrity scanning protein DisA with diadenylate cyclase activity